MEMNVAQKQVVSHIEGPLLVLAGPGSGKTFVIIERICYLIEQGVKPEKILVVTFTKAAAREMQERFQKRMPGKAYGIFFGTFHALFFKILQQSCGYRTENILKEQEKWECISAILQEKQILLEEERSCLEGILGEISFCKGTGQRIEQYESLYCTKEQFQEVYMGYQSYLQAHRKIDFDDMAIICQMVLQQKPHILQLWQERYDFFIVDEAQDTNEIQYLLIELLAERTKNLCLVGDDDQSLYQFRGAKPESLLQFSKHYSNTKQVILNFNYRSKQSIISCAQQLIRNNCVRFEKKVETVRGPGKPVQIQEFATLRQEYEQTCMQLKEWQQKQIPLEDIAVLFRTNVHLYCFRRTLEQHQIPFCQKGTTRSIYEGWIFQDLYSYLQIAQGRMKRSYFLQILNRPNRFLSRTIFQQEQVTFSEVKQKVDNHSALLQLEQLERELLFLKSLPPYAAISYIRLKMGYEAFLKEYAIKNKIEAELLLNELLQLQESARPYLCTSAWIQSIEKRKTEWKKQQQKQEGVQLLTYHASKGLEFPIVYLLDLNEEIVPHSKAITREALEEERRMLYVAMTRAKEELYMYYPMERNQKKAMPSRFLREVQL